MRKLILFMAACFIAGSFFLTVQPASAASYVSYDGPWVANVGQNIDISVTFFSNNTNYGFGIFDWGKDVTNVENRIELVTGAGFIFESTIATKKGDEFWVGDLNIGDTAEFGLYFREIDSYYTKGLSYLVSDNGDTYSLKSVDVYDGIYGLTIDDVNPSPVPIPTAFLLLGSGLVGLVGFRRKNKN